MSHAYQPVHPKSPTDASPADTEQAAQAAAGKPGGSRRYNNININNTLKKTGNNNTNMNDYEY